MSCEVCVYLYGEIIKIWLDWYSDEVDKGVIKIMMMGILSDKLYLCVYVYFKDVCKNLEKWFKDFGDELKIVIVCDMWLIGFDVLVVNMLYVDKLMCGYNLM